VTGWSYAWLAQLSFTHDSWTAPLDVQRVQAGGNAHAVAAAQIWELVERLPANGPVPLFVFDAGYNALRRVGAHSIPFTERRGSENYLWVDGLPEGESPTEQ